MQASPTQPVMALLGLKGLEDGPHMVGAVVKCSRLGVSPSYPEWKRVGCDWEVGSRAGNGKIGNCGILVVARLVQVEFGRRESLILRFSRPKLWQLQSLLLCLIQRAQKGKFRN